MTVLQIDPVAKIIPLVIDYILEFEMAEESSLADILQLNEEYVRLALTRLTSHGILNFEEFQFEHFQRKFADKLGLKNYKFEGAASETI